MLDDDDDDDDEDDDDDDFLFFFTGLMPSVHVCSTTQVDVCKRVIHLYRSVVLEVPMEPSTW